MPEYAESSQQADGPAKSRQIQIIDSQTKNFDQLSTISFIIFFISRFHIEWLFLQSVLPSPR